MGMLTKNHIITLFKAPLMQRTHNVHILPEQIKNYPSLQKLILVQFRKDVSRSL